MLLTHLELHCKQFRLLFQAVSIAVPLSGFSSKRETACSLARRCRKRRLGNLSNMMNTTPDTLHPYTICQRGYQLSVVIPKPRLLSQSQTVVTPNQSNRLITLDTQLKTALMSSLLFDFLTRIFRKAGTGCDGRSDDAN